MALSAGNIAFVGFNVDGNDDFAFVAIVDINLGCDLNIIQLLGSNRKPILIELVPKLFPTS
jgi:hypothetical protein